VTLVNESGAEVIYVDGGHYLQLGEQKVMVSQELGNKEYLLPFAVYLLEGGIQQSMDSIRIFNSLGERIMPNMDNATFPRVRFYMPGHDTTSITIIY
jgi:hypothetical protein